MANKINITNLKFHYKDESGKEIEILNYIGEDLDKLISIIKQPINNISENSKQTDCAVKNDEEVVNHGNTSVGEDIIRNRLPNFYDKEGKEIPKVEMAHGYNRFACPNCFQGLIIILDNNYVLSHNDELYMINTNKINMKEAFEKFIDCSESDKRFEMLKLIQEDFDIIIKANEEDHQIIMITKDEDIFCRCPFCNANESLFSFVSEYEQLANDRNVCRICGVGDISMVIKETGENSLECDNCLY